MTITDIAPMKAAQPAADAIEESVALPPRSDMRSLRREHGWEPLVVEGTIPEGLRGTMYRIGPGLYETFGRSVAHSFEADGAVSAVRIEGRERASGAIRVIESAGLLAERRANRPLFGSRASAFRRLLNALELGRKNTGNTAALYWQERLYALVESSPPTELDPSDLTTIGESRLGGAVGSAFTAHPHRVNARETTYAFGMRWGPRNAIELHALPDRGAARRIGEVPLEHGVLLHDFTATQRHLVFLVPPMRLNVIPALLGRGASDIFRWHPDDGVEVIVVPIDDPTRVVRFRVESFFQWHFAGAWDEPDGTITLHFAHWKDFSSYEGLRSSGVSSEVAHLHRATIDPARKTFRMERVAPGSHEFPEIDARAEGARYRHVLGTTASGARRGVARTDVERGVSRRFLFEEGQCPSELVLVPRADAPEGEGWGLTLVHDAARDRSFLAIIDTARIEDGPIAKLWFAEHVPMTFHGVWVPAAK